MTRPIRYSPSGPVIGNAEGGQAVPGNGFDLRLSDDLGTQGVLTLSSSDQVIPTSDGDLFLRAELTNPSPNLRYRAKAWVTFANANAAAQTVSMRFAWSVDGNPVFTGSADFNVGMAATVAQAQMCCLSQLTLGSALPQAVLDTSTSLRVQLEAANSSGDVTLISGQQCYLELWESL